MKLVVMEQGLAAKLREVDAMAPAGAPAAPGAQPNPANLAMNVAQAKKAAQDKVKQIQDQIKQLQSSLDLGPGPARVDGSIEYLKWLLEYPDYGPDLGGRNRLIQDVNKIFIFLHFFVKISKFFYFYAKD